MNERVITMDLVYNLTLKELVEITGGLLQEALDVASASRILMLKTSDDLCNVPLRRDLLLSWVSRAMGARVQLQFWMEMNEYANGLRVSQIGQTYTHGSVLAMDLTEHLPTIVYMTELLARAIDATNEAEGRTTH